MQDEKLTEKSVDHLVNNELGNVFGSLPLSEQLEFVEKANKLFINFLERLRAERNDVVQRTDLEITSINNSLKALSVFDDKPTKAMAS